ncbi:T9SS type A sorting domain-containing protein [Tellurirhabdus rosea]|uniref:T9SS type A sorting domain-containing protein n=1 Tax=Tellurirhabdus rosea TaxID=2674997 RepID=UPI002254AD1A|nr:T9SS type A sorting domain-containing protein [Tellurirhabdus rosea]
MAALAQVNITYPTSRMVFQRNNANQATFRVGGFYSVPVNRVEVRAIPLQGGSPTDWMILQNNPQGGAFAGNITLNGGWYQLQIRGVQGENVINGPAVDRVGVGEVFVIAGQSNAQGFANYGGPGASDDRVNCVNHIYGTDQPETEPPYPTFSHLDANAFISPRGEAAWCWGYLGDLLARRLNVPILFFNAAWTATGIKSWRETAEGRTGYSVYGGFSYPQGQPYGNLKQTLQFYVNSVGVRAVLWLQGESDHYANMSQGEYVDHLRVLIQKTREHSGKNLSWVVCRTSYDDTRGSSPAILEAQNEIIRSVPNVFEGPNTDLIQIPRSDPNYYPGDDVHFRGGGLLTLGQAWSDQLNDRFFQNSQPHGPAVGPNLSIGCAGLNTLALNVSGTSGNLRWNTGSTNATLTAGSGRYFATIRDGNGNVTFTAPYEVPARPTISPSGPTTICEGQNVTLTSSYPNSTWNGSTSGRSITTGQAGSYVASTRDVAGCEFVSDPIQVSVNPLPQSPTARSLNPTRFCDRQFTTLEASEGFAYTWNTGERSRQIQVRRQGVYTVSVTDQNGCTSPQSNPVEVRVDPLPSRPVISASGPTTFCADQSVTLTSSPEDGYIWRNGLTGRTVLVNQSGDYVVQTRNTFGCLSDPSNVISVRVNPLPPAPTLTAGGATTFCEGDRVTLTANSPFQAIWSRGDTAQSIVATSSGRYVARVRDGNGCLSPTSSAITVDVKAVPSVPTVVQAGTYTLQASGSLAGDYYEWERSNQVIPFKGQEIKATVEGEYRARAFIVYDKGLTCFSAFSSSRMFTPFLENEGLSVYPNPSIDKRISVETFDNIKNATVTLYTLNGQLVLTETVDVFDERKSLNLSMLPPGHYILNVRSAEFKGSKRLMIGM